MRQAGVACTRAWKEANDSRMLPHFIAHIEKHCPVPWVKLKVLIQLYLFNRNVALVTSGLGKHAFLVSAMVIHQVAILKLANAMIANMTPQVHVKTVRSNVDYSTCRPDTVDNISSRILKDFPLFSFIFLLRQGVDHE